MKALRLSLVVSLLSLSVVGCIDRYHPIGDAVTGEGGTGGTASGFDGGFFIPDAIELDTAPCEPATCATLGKNCGAVADGCGGILECGQCGADQRCGIVTANVCTDLATLCERIPREQACAGKECGVEGDGCGGTYSCGTCAQGEACGYETPFRCGTIPEGSTEDCPGRIRSCVEAGAQCGIIGNGCGGTIDCDQERGGCPSGQFCGGGGPQRCGAPTCTPLAPAVACQGKCGVVSNGCGVDVNGGVIDCSALFPCPSGQACGAGGVPNQCGSAAGTCQPIPRATACGTRACGQVSDGCDGTYRCGSNDGACPQGQQCRSGACEPLCTPTPQATACQGKSCGVVGDGCGGTYSCGTCPSGQQCGVLVAFQCDVPPPAQCVPLTRDQACQGKQCGTVFDGCGSGVANQINCGTCPSGTFCGLNQPFQCAAPSMPNCTPATSCAQLGWACGFAVDSCGNVFDCAAENRRCGPFETCVGGVDGMPTRCEVPQNLGCPLCAAIPNCTGQSQVTQIRGRVITPGQNDANTANQVGVPNAFVYILRTNDLADLPAISSGVPANGTACDRCADQDLGPILASAVTDAEGNYTLSGNIPVGAEFILVVKVGKFRRAIRRTIPAADACRTVNFPTSMPNNPTRLPRAMDDGLAVNIPRVAVSTGEIDAMECVLWKMGIATSQFSRPQLGGRIHLYRANGTWPDQQSQNCNGCNQQDNSNGRNCRTNNCGGSAVSFRTDFLHAINAERITETGGRLHEYDLVVFNCEADSNAPAPPDDRLGNLRNFANRGGRMFFSHHTVKWLHTEPAGFGTYSIGTPFQTGFGGAGTYSSSSSLATGTGRVSFGRANASPRLASFANWLVREGVTTAPGYTFDIVQPRSRATAVGSSSEEFVHCDGGDCTGGSRRPQQFSFNTPYAAPSANACGRVAYSGFHVATTADTNLGAAVGGSAVFPNLCQNGGNPRALSGQEKVLLYMLFDLGACVGSEPQPPSCTPRACQAGSCGPQPDGCGGTLNCSCPTGQACSGTQCVTPGCTPTTCQAEGATCGVISNGCGGVLNCGECPICTRIPQNTACMGRCGFASDGCGSVYDCGGCPEGLSCSNGMCTPGICQRATTCPQGLNCGYVSDNCDGLVHCGDCPAPQTCGGSGTPNVCGVPECRPLRCQDVGAQCGIIGDGCGGTVNCGTCPQGQSCGIVSGVPNQCQGCQPRTCQDAGAQCGAIGNGCGGIVQCGNCPAGQICGAQAPNQCGSGAMCTPQTCQSAGAECGLIGNGCGGQVDCGDCPPGKVCGIETPFRCGDPPPCTPRTCRDAGAFCGAIGDGCGGVVNCGDCPEGYTCGAVQANQCYGAQ